jgi:hypothetical protein
VSRIRILVSFEEDHRVYQETTAIIIRELRPHVEVSVTELNELEAEVARLSPDLVICSRPKNVPDAGRVLAWLRLPTGHYRSAELYLDGEYSEMDNPGLEELLRVVDETEKLGRVKTSSRNC